MNELFIAEITDLKRQVKDLQALETPSYTSGAVLFGASTGNPTQDATNLFWDDTNNRLGIGTNSPSARLTLNGTNASYSAGPHSRHYLD